MECWDWEFFETEVTSDVFVVTDHGPLFGPVTDFSIVRDESLDLVLETTSASDSTSNEVERPAGSVYDATEEVKLETRFGTAATAEGVIPRRYTRSVSTRSAQGATKQTSTVHSLRWTCRDASEPRYVIEWVENMAGPFIWPHFDNTEETGETQRILKSPGGEVVLSSPIHSKQGSRSCVRLVVDGVELFVGRSRAKPKHVSKPGFILYVGTPDEDLRWKIRDCLSFCLGNFLVYLGDTTFDSMWNPVAFNALAGHALVDEAPDLNGWQPAPLGRRWKHEIDPELLGRMLSSLCGIYETYGLQSVFWSYWHALAAPVHMAAVHFGSALEAIKTAYFKASGSATHGRIVEDEQAWNALHKKIAACIADADLPDAVKTMLANKAITLNSAPQGVVMERFFSALGLELGTLEKKVWKNRNRAAHGGSADADKANRLIRENKVLLILMNRILLALGSGGDHYYDYYSLGHPIVRLADPIRDDQSAETAS